MYAIMAYYYTNINLKQFKSLKIINERLEIVLLFKILDWD